MIVAATNPKLLSSVARGAQRTGADFKHLLATAQIESGGDHAARAATSSAAGLFQFTEQTWLQAVHQHGPRHGLDHAANAIQKTTGGRYIVSQEDARHEILALRHDETVSAAMAGELTKDNQAALTAELGRAPSGAELYLAHFLGAAGASRMLKAAAEPDPISAASVLPAAARANANLFYRHGQAVTAQYLVGRIQGLYERVLTSVQPISAPAPVETRPAASVTAGAGKTEREPTSPIPAYPRAAETRILSMNDHIQEVRMRRYIEIAATARHAPASDPARRQDRADLRS
jgi:hypothetical protein